MTPYRKQTLLSQLLMLFLVYKKSWSQLMIFISFSIEKNIVPCSLFHLTSCTPTKSNLYLANSLTAAVSKPALYSLLTFHVPKKMFLFLLHDISPRNTPPGNPRGGVVYLRIVLSPEEASRLVNIS